MLLRSEELFSFYSCCFCFVYCDIYLLPDEFSADPVWFGWVERESVLAIQVYIESRWLKFFLEWFTSAQTLRGQSKHKATLSNLLHSILWHSCPNGSGLLRMTMNQTLAELFAQPYIDVKHMPGLCQSPDFISLTYGTETTLSTFINKTPKGWNFSWRSGVASPK